MVEVNGKKEDSAMNSTDSKAAVAEASPSAQLASILVLLERSVRAKDTKMIVGRLMRQTAAVRSKLDADNLATFIEEALPADQPTRPYLISQLKKVMRSPANTTQ